MTTKLNSSLKSNTPAKKTAAGKSATAKPAVKKPVKVPVGELSNQADKKTKKNHKEKVVRDSFTMPQSEYQKIADIKESCLKAGLHVKKSEVLRAGLKALCEKNDVQLKQSLRNLEKIQTGRPKKH